MIQDDGKQELFNTSTSVLFVFCFACLVPFLNKAFHIDDPTFLGMAKHIQSNPLDYFGYYMQFSPPLITNPPLVAYFIAIPGYLFGYSEVSIHAAFVLPAAATIIGTYLLARDLCEKPLLAAFAALSAPIFLVSSTTIMCDVLMLVFWVFGIYFWRRGIRENKRAYLISSSVLIVLCVLTKYMGICLVPLLLAYSLFEKRKLGEWLLYLLLPVVALLLFDHITYIKYGVHQINVIGTFSLYHHKVTHKNSVANTVTGLSFLGGGLLVHWLYFVAYTQKRSILFYFSAIILVLILLMGFDLLDYYPIAGVDGINWSFVVQLPFFVFAGASFMFITISDFVRSRDSDSLLLLLWIMGTFVFTVFINWSVNGRSILPITPLAGIMVIRYLQQTGKLPLIGKLWLYAPLLISLIIALIVTVADYSLANSARTAAHKIHKDTINQLGKKWIEGEWGFKHYIEELGGVESLNYDKPSLKKGDIVIIPANNTNTKMLYKHLALFKKQYTFDVSKLFSTMSLNKGAGFYTDLAGPLPFAIGYVPESYYVYEILMDKTTAFTY